MLVSFYQWFKGYLIIQIMGYSPERFLNLCKNKNIHIWKITPDNNTYKIRILLKNIYELKSISKKTGVRLKIIKRCGFPFWVSRLKKRKIFLLCILLSIIFLLMTRNCIWEINLSGNHILTEDVVLSFLDKQKIFPGTLKRKIDCPELVTLMRNEFDNIVWSSFSINGTSLCISVKEKADIIQSNKKEIFEEIKAKCNGTVVKMITRSGVPMVSVGDKVNKDDILVIGDADIWIETVIPYQDEILSTYSYKKYNAKIKYGISRIGKKYILNNKSKSYANSMIEILSEDKWGIKLHKYKAYDWAFDSYSEEERADILNDNLKRYCKKLEDNNTSIKEQNINITHYINKSISSGTIRLIYLHKIW